MSTVAVLPSTLREKLDAAARRIRLLRAVRGCSVLALALILTGAATLTADAWLDLPSFARQALFSAWIGMGAGLAIFGVLVPLCRRIDLDALAALIEVKYPDLGERLTSSVELTDDKHLANGSPALIALLIEETERRASPLDFLHAVPTRHTAWVAWAALVAFLAAAVAGISMPGRFAQLCERFLFPAETGSGFVPYAVTVTPGDAIAAKGRPLTVAAKVQPLAEKVALPRSATLIVTDADGNVSRLPMQTDDTVFSLQMDAIAGDFQYRVETGAASSETYKITAVEPINLAAESPKLTITPPAYARQTFKESTLIGFHDLAVLQHSRVRLEFRFTQAARAAYLSWPGDNKGGAQLQTLALADDRLSGSIDLPALADGPYKLLLKGENGFDTEFAGHKLTVKIDQPPAVAHFLGGDKARSDWKVETDPTGTSFQPVKGDQSVKSVLPYDSVPLDITLTDDVGIASAHIEYRINGRPVQLEEIALKGLGTTQATARHAFRLSGKVSEGDELRYRLRISDNRDVPEAGLKPHVVYYPAERWLALKVSRAAEPLAQNAIQTQRDDVNKRLEAIKKDLEREQRGLYKLRQESRMQPSLLPEQALELKSLRKTNEGSREALEQLARDAAETPSFQPFAEAAHEVADEELRRTETAMTEAEKDTESAQRSRRLLNADKDLTAALMKLDDLRRANERLTQERLDQAKLELATQRQEELARRAAELAEKDPIKDATAKPQSEQLQREQKDVADELERTTNQSEPLRKALDEARAEQARKLGQQASKLAKEERDLAKPPERNEQLEALARKQQELAEKADKLAKETKQPAQAALTAPLKPDNAKMAAEALKQGDAGEALKHQEQSANELQRVAGDLDKASDVSRDPKEAARQLARLQKGMQDRLVEETRSKDNKTPLAARIEALESDQKAIAKAAESLAVPGRNELAQREQKEAVAQADKAADAVQKHNPARANQKMDQARQALERLADRLPSLQQRQQEAAAEVERLRQKQREVGRQAAEATKQADKQDPQAAQKLSEAARRQANVAEEVGKIDAPNQRAPQQQAQEAANRALKNLLDGKPQDIASSQQKAESALQRLQEAVAGNKQAAEQQAGSKTTQPASPESAQQSQQAARALAKQQRDLAKSTQQARDDAGKQPEAQRQQALKKAMERARDKQKDLNQKAAQMPVEQAQKAQVQARQAMRDAEQALGKEDTAKARQKQEEAADALDRLAQQMAQAPAKSEARPDHPATPQGMPSKQQAEQARDLAQQQRELRDAVRRLTDEATRADQKPQQNLQQQTAKLSDDLHRLAKQLNRSADKQQAAQKACAACQQAQSAMQQAQSQGRQGNQGQAQKSQQQAAEALDRAAQQLAKGAGQPQPQAQHTGEALKQAQDNMSQAQGQLSQGQRQGAQTSMQKAAQSLQQALQQLAQKASLPTKGGQPNQVGAAPGGKPDLEAPSIDPKKYAGKPWGDLPGELQTKIIQDLKAKYGDDYARIIKLYFEQIADTKQK
jgi:hypothetical protein